MGRYSEHEPIPGPLEDGESDEDDEEQESPSVTQAVISWIWFFFKLGFALTVIAMIVITGAVIGILKGFSEQIPIVSDKTYRPNLTSQVFDNKGNLIARLHAEENRTRILTGAEIPKLMRSAVVAIEDERFYQHYGIDLVGIARAMVKNVQAGRVVQGASTLTQQLVKNAFLTSEKTFKRKAVEAMLAFQLERKYSKEEILTLYLNEIYFGHGAYGLDAAAKMYFNKAAKDLNLVECATLAGIPKSPVAFSPHKYPENNRSRRELVLAKMVELGFISPADYQDAVTKVPHLVTEKQEVMKFPYFVTYVRDALLEKYGANLVYTGGLKIYTTIDSSMQAFAEEAMVNSDILKSRPSEKDPGMNGSLVCIEHKTGHIKAMFGGRDWERSQFNRVTQAYRQPGSSFKPFVYGCALENGALPGDMITDEPISFVNPWSKKVWAPKNYDLKFHGTVSLMKAIANSFNVPAVKLINQLTPAKVIRFTRKLGVSAQMQPNLALALGAGNFTPLEMASAYGAFANLGIHVSPIAITRVEDRDGNLLEESIPQAREVMKGTHAAMLTDMLRTAVERGTGRRAMIKGRQVAGKTGTTNNYIDAWFNGYTPELVTVVQFGYDQPKPLGPKKAGGTVCCPVWKAFMEKALQFYPESEFPVPEGSVRLRMCMTSGRAATKGCPGQTVVNQVYPVESLPKTECTVHSGGRQYVVEDDENVEFASGLNSETVAQAAAQADAEFFQDDYSISPEDALANAEAEDDEDEDDDAPPMVSARTPQVAPVVRPGTGLIGRPSIAIEGDEASPGVAATQSPVRREPGVVMQPSVEFRDSFQ
jgi:penicillin-binding protein 1A